MKNVIINVIVQNKKVNLRVNNIHKYMKQYSVDVKKDEENKKRKITLVSKG